MSKADRYASHALYSKLNKTLNLYNKGKLLQNINLLVIRISFDYQLIFC
jgi:hypothetical protein